MIFRSQPNDIIRQACIRGETCITRTGFRNVNELARAASAPGCARSAAERPSTASGGLGEKSRSSDIFDRVSADMHGPVIVFDWAVSIGPPPRDSLREEVARFASTTSSETGSIRSLLASSSMTAGLPSYSLHPAYAHICRAAAPSGTTAPVIGPPQYAAASLGSITSSSPCGASRPCPSAPR